MFKNKIVHLVYRAFFLALSFFGIINSFIRFDTGEFNTDFYTYFTNFSNYYAFVVMLFLFVNNFKEVLRGDIYGASSKYIFLEYTASITVFVTGFLYTFIGYYVDFFPEYFFTVSNFTFHSFCPLLFVLDFFLFSEHFKIKPSYIYYSLLFPLGYECYILTIGLFIPNFPYPYFFMDPVKIGYWQVLMWVPIFSLFFFFIASLFWIYDKTYVDSDNKFRFDLKNKHNHQEKKD